MKRKPTKTGHPTTSHGTGDGHARPEAGAWRNARSVLLSRPTALAATLSVYAGAIHLHVVPAHLRQWWGFGAFFLVVGIAQVGLGVLLWRGPTFATLLAGIWGNVAVMLVYVLSRTNGLPIGPEQHGETGVETVGALDLTATAAEVVVAVYLLVFLPARIRPVMVNALFATGLGLWLLRFLGALG